MKKLSPFILLMAFCTSCVMPLEVRSVSYQSMVNGRSDLEKTVPSSASIFAAYGISSDGDLVVEVYNLTGSIMKIDRTQSFFINTDGSSNAYYDPNIQYNSTTVSSSTTNSVSTNLGSLASAVGVGGPLGTALGGVNVGTATTNGISQTSAVYSRDQQIVSVAPRGKIDMGRIFRISEAGKPFLDNLSANGQDISLVNSPRFCFGIVICYSTDNGETYSTLETACYNNNLVSHQVKKYGRPNETLRTVLSETPESLYQPWYLFYSKTITKKRNNTDNTYMVGALYDYK